MGKEGWLSSYLEWVEGNVDRIQQDASQPLAVLNTVHNFYFTTSYNPSYPNIGYLIGYLYLKYLHARYTLQELRTFSKRGRLNQEEFASFLAARKRDGSMVD